MNIAAKNRAICILGMHRSGTSVMTRLLNLLGVYLGEETDLLPPESYNPEGLWERRDFNQFNESLLRQLKRTWATAVLLPDNWHTSPELRPMRDQLAGLIHDHLLGHQLWGWKDPRTMLLLPLWQMVLEEVGTGLCCVFMVRNPLDVARSLEKRNAFSDQKSFGIWFNYNISALRVLRNVPTSYVSFERIFIDSEYELNKCAEILKINWPEDSQDVRDKIRSFVRPELCHSTSTAEDLKRSNAPQPVIELYVILMTLTRNRSPFSGSSDSDIFDRVESLYEEFYWYSLFLQDDMNALWDCNEEKNQLSHTVWQQRDQFQAEDQKKTSEYESAITALTLTNEQKIADLALSKEKAIAALALSREQEIADLTLSREQEIAALTLSREQEIAALKSEIIPKDHEILRLKAIEESMTWKTAKKIFDLVDNKILPVCRRLTGVIRSHRRER